MSILQMRSWHLLSQLYLHSSILLTLPSPHCLIFELCLGSQVLLGCPQSMLLRGSCKDIIVLLSFTASLWGSFTILEMAVLLILM